MNTYKCVISGTHGPNHRPAGDFYLQVTLEAASDSDALEKGRELLRPLRVNESLAMASRIGEKP
jgi:hypothetical protein